MKKNKLKNFQNELLELHSEEPNFFLEKKSSKELRIPSSVGDGIPEPLRLLIFLIIISIVGFLYYYIVFLGYGRMYMGKMVLSLGTLF